MLAFIMLLNKPDKQFAFGQLPPHVQEQMKAMYKRGILIEVYGEVTRNWQTISQMKNHGEEWRFKPKQFYRLAGNTQVAMQNFHGKKAYVSITEIEALPETAVPFSSEGRGAICHIINLK
jgi:hypothetical protein